MVSRKFLALALTLALGITGSATADDTKAADKSSEIALLGLNFIVDDAATVLPMEKDKKIELADVSDRLMETLKDNNNVFARLESIRRATHHILRQGDDQSRKTEAKQVIDVLKDCYVEKGGQLGRSDPKEPGRSPENPNPGTSLTADKVDAVLRGKVFARVDLAYGLAVFCSADLIDEKTAATDFKPCKEYLDEAIGMQPMPELSFCAAVACAAARTKGTLEGDVEKTKRLDDCQRHLQDAVNGSTSGDLLDRNLVHCFGIEKIQKLRGEVAPGRDK